MKESLLAAGFKPFVQCVFGHEHAIANYQHCFRDDEGKRYCITVFEYSYSDLTPWLEQPHSFHFSAQFHDAAGNERAVNIDTSGSEASELPGILAMFKALWQSLGAVYDEKY